MKADVPKGKGFPFTIPAVEWLLKLFKGKDFLLELLENGFSLWKDEKITAHFQEIIIMLNSLLTPELLNRISLLKNYFAVFNRLREILDDEDEISSKIIKQRINAYIKKLQRKLNLHPDLKYGIIINRLNKYKKYLYQCYDDDCIPKTNLEIERTFNRGKRDFRKRTGLKERKSFIIIEGEVFFLLNNFKEKYPETTNVSVFIADLRKERLLFTTKEFNSLVKQYNIRKQDNRAKIKKNSFKQALNELNNLKGELKEISLKAN